MIWQEVNNDWKPVQHKGNRQKTKTLHIKSEKADDLFASKDNDDNEKKVENDLLEESLTAEECTSIYMFPT